MLLTKKTKLLSIICVAVVGVYIGFRFLLPLFTPFIFAYFIAWILFPVVKFLSGKLRFPRMVSSIMSLALVGGILTFIFSYLSKLLFSQIVTLLKNMPIYLNILASKVDTFCKSFDKLFGIESGTMREVVDNQIDNVIIIVRTRVIPSVTAKSLHLAIGIIGLTGILLIIIVSCLLLLKDEEKYKESFKSNCFYPDIHLITGKLSETGIAYLKTQTILMCIISLICFLGLMLIGNKYALLIGIGIGIFDAFPILGSGLILVPWSIISFVNQDIYSAAVLLTLYLICQIVRQFLEPKLLGNRIGIKPVFTLMSIYAGLQLFGFTGFFLGPLGMIIIVTIVKEASSRLNYEKSVKDEEVIKE